MPAEFEIGVGTWSWGERLIWDFGSDYDEQSLSEVFLRALRDRVLFFSTSESFAEGRAEQILGDFLSRATERPFVSSKDAPYPWRLRRADFKSALRASLTRLRIPALDLYQVLPPAGWMGLPVLAECLSEAYDSGLVRAVGVSNFTAQQIEQFYELLNRFGTPLSFVETEYSLLDRDIERNGVMEVCGRLNLRIIAQRPLAMGVLTGKFLSRPEPEGARRKFLSKYRNPSLSLLIRLMNNIGSEYEGKNCAQVSLNWLIRKGVVPIPGAKRIDQVMQNNQAAGWSLTDEDVQRLDDLSANLLNLNKETSSTEEQQEA